VVDDDPSLRRMLERTLAAEGYDVTVAADGGGALVEVERSAPDVIVLDVAMPALDGLAVCRRLRSRGLATPILMLTARDAVHDRVSGLEAGADDYLVKPFSFTELAARLRALTRRGQPERPTVLTVGDLRLDPASRRAWRGEDELDLSAKEFALLELFLRHPGEVLTRTKMLDQVWDYAYDGVSNVVDQYIAYLRRKIDRPYGRNDLETVRGAGYRLRDPSAC
jgi:two-component system, OmpR family, response regulator